ncbi:MAG: 1-acyl-sn-glycerol-3-phosphate acyltransferase [Chlamydiales bacterium]|nr:1-acyl-sn-glycerol-3-phosphate acyltransferase [Chlamydiales bacterium]
MYFSEQLKKYTEQGIIPQNYHEVLSFFYKSYKESVAQADDSLDGQEVIFLKLLELLKKEKEHPFIFEHYHQQVRAPFDYYQFGIDFARPLIDKKASVIVNKHNLVKIREYLSRDENVVLLANHQTEMDPQIIQCLLEDANFDFASNMIFVAGEKVVTDLLAIPFSMGCNLLCIYSKRHIDHDPELKSQKQQHNQKTMKRMSALFKEGGKCIYVAPSGGRDRRNKEGLIEVAPFDANSIEMFRLMALQSKSNTHFFPLALSTYDILPPPSTIEKGVGEKRSATRAKAHLCFGDECDMHALHEKPASCKHEKRKLIADAIWNQVKQDFLMLTKL